MDKEGILGILNGLNAFLKGKNGNSNVQQPNKTATLENKPSQFDTTPNTSLPEQMEYDQKQLSAIAKYEKHVRYIGKKVD